jgi:hypothetical protein
MNRDPSTYGSIARRYDEWVKIRSERPALERVLPPPRPYTPEPQRNEMGKSVSAAIGVVIGLLILALAALSFATAYRWAELARDGAATGYTVVGFFLLLAGVGGIIATLNHNFRVLAPGARRSAH